MRTAGAQPDHRIQFFLAISVALHLLVFRAFLIPFLSSLELPAVRPVIEIVELPRAFRSPALPEPAPAPLPAEEARAAAAPEAPPEATPAPEPPAPRPDRLRDVVDISKPAAEEAPRDARFLAKYSQRVERPARARDLPIDNRGEISRRKEVDPFAKPSAEESGERAAEAREAQEAQAARARVIAGGGDGESRGERNARAGAPGEAGLPTRVGADAIFTRKKKAGAEGQRAATGGPAGPGQGIQDLLPTEERLAQLGASARGGRSNPYNPDLVAVDAEMSMDTLRDEHTGYFLTLKRRFSRNWDPQRLLRAADDYYQQTVRNFGGNSAIAAGARSAFADAVARTGRGATLITFKIAKNGQLDGEPRMLRSSGSRFLDEEALRAVALGAPFPPVPDRLARNSLTLQWWFIYGSGGPR